MLTLAGQASGANHNGAAGSEDNRLSGGCLRRCRPVPELSESGERRRGVASGFLADRPVLLLGHLGAACEGGRGYTSLSASSNVSGYLPGGGRNARLFLGGLDLGDLVFY